MLSNQLTSPAANREEFNAIKLKLDGLIVLLESYIARLSKEEQNLHMMNKRCLNLIAKRETVITLVKHIPSFKRQPLCLQPGFAIRNIQNN